MLPEHFAASVHPQSPHAIATDAPTRYLVGASEGHATSPAARRHAWNAGAGAGSHAHLVADVHARTGVDVAAATLATPADVHVPAPDGDGGTARPCCP